MELSMEDVMKKATVIEKTVLDKVKKEPSFELMGVECISIYFTSVRPTPELSKALEAEYRESLQKKADEAIYSRRASAVEQERKIKENELNSQIALEKKNQELVDLKGNNTIKTAEYESKALEMRLAVYKNIDPKILLGLGMKSLGENANRIGNLTITPDLLSAIIQDKSDTSYK
jgi:hypothetical protein